MICVLDSRAEPNDTYHGTKRERVASLWVAHPLRGVYIGMMGDHVVNDARFVAPAFCADEKEARFQSRSSAYSAKCG